MDEDIKVMVERLRGGDGGWTDTVRRMQLAADILERLAKENEALKKQVRYNSFAGEGYAFMEDRAEAAEARVEELEVERDALKEEYHAFEHEVEQREEEFARKMGVLEARAEAAEARDSDLHPNKNGDMRMKEYMVLTAIQDDKGIRVYPTYSPSAVVALRDAMRQDFKDYPDNPSDFSAVEVFAVGRSELSI